MEEKFRVVNCDLRDCLKCSYLEIRQRYDVDRMCDYLFCKLLQDRIVDLPLEDCPYSISSDIGITFTEPEEDSFGRLMDEMKRGSGIIKGWWDK